MFLLFAFKTNFAKIVKYDFDENEITTKLAPYPDSYRFEKRKKFLKKRIYRNLSESFIEVSKA